MSYDPSPAETDLVRGIMAMSLFTEQRLASSDELQLLAVIDLATRLLTEIQGLGERLSAELAKRHGTGKAKLPEAAVIAFPGARRPG